MQLSGKNKESDLIRVPLERQLISSIFPQKQDKPPKDLTNT